LTITAVARPFLLTFRATGHTYPLSSDEAQRALDEYPAVSATAQRVVLQGHNTSDPRQRIILTPATRGGGPAFVIADMDEDEDGRHEPCDDCERSYGPHYTGCHCR
jgi:hypothetical protein